MKKYSLLENMFRNSYFKSGDRVKSFDNKIGVVGKAGIYKKPFPRPNFPQDELILIDVLFEGDSKESIGYTPNLFTKI